MPIPKFEFEDADAGLPRQPVPVRFACMAADWTPALLAEVVLGEMNEGYSLLAVHEYDPATNWEGMVQPHTYEPYRQYRGQPLPDQLKKLPVNQFVWSNEFAWVFSYLNELTIGRESAASMAIRWKPALGNCADIVSESTDLSALTRSAFSDCSLRISGKACIAYYAGVQGQFKESKGLRYLVILLRRPKEDFSVNDLELEVNPPHPDALGKEVSHILDAPEEGDVNAGFTVGNATDAGGAIDAKTKKDVRKAIKELDDKIEIAADSGNHVLRAQSEAVREELLDYLGKSLNIHNQPRPVDSPQEQKRKNVLAAITRAIDDIKGTHRALGDHLAASIRTGNFCSYVPAPLITWQITIVKSSTSAQ